jgi:lipopolysaccharide transport system ATP-binding protein
MLKQRLWIRFEMSNTVISIENVSKSYQLGVISTGTFYGDLKRWWAKQRGLPDPYQKIGEVDHGNRQGETLWALKDINLKIQQGEVLGIIGRNGAGKSTLLKILSRVTAPTSGEIKVKGRIASLLEVGTGFHPELTGRENIYMNGAILGMTRREINRKFDEIVDFSGVEKFIDTPVKRYSSGMYVRLAFAVAAHLEPEILIVDEVLAVGDAAFQKKCLGKMDDVAQEGRTVLFVSHNMSAIAKLCPRVIWLSAGAITMDGDSELLVDRYLNAGQTQETEKTWLLENAPGDHIAKLLGVRSLNIDQKPCGIFDVRESIILQMDYIVLSQTSYQLTPIFRIFDGAGNIIFLTAEYPDGSDKYDKKIGHPYRSTCTIPGNLLNEGYYSVAMGVSTFEKRTPHFYVEQAISFQVNDSMKPDGAGGNVYARRLPGVIRPLLEWNTEPLRAT